MSFASFRLENFVCKSEFLSFARKENVTDIIAAGWLSYFATNIHTTVDQQNDVDAQTVCTKEKMEN